MPPQWRQQYGAHTIIINSIIVLSYTLGLARENERKKGATVEERAENRNHRAGFKIEWQIIINFEDNFLFKEKFVKIIFT